MGRKSIFAKNGSKPNLKEKVLLACMPSAKGCGGQSPTWRFDLSPLLLYGFIVQFLQTFRRTQWSRGWMKARREGIKRSHRHKKSANVQNSYYLEHLPRHPSAIPLYRRSWTVRLLAATEEGAAEKLRGSNATCHLYKHLKFFQPFLTSSCIAPQQYANSNNSQFCHCKR